MEQGSLPYEFDSIAPDDAPDPDDEAISRWSPEDCAWRQTEAVRIDYLRRKDQAVAVIEMAMPLWEKMTTTAEQIQENETSKGRKAEWIFFFLGALIQWWLEPDGKFEFNFGTTVMVFAASSFVANMLQVASWRKLEVQMDAQQDQLLYKWLECGAFVVYFWSFRSSIRQEININEVAEDTDAWRERSYAVSNKRDKLWGQVKRHLLQTIGVKVPDEAYGDW